MDELSKKSWGDRFLTKIEVIGNKLPDPTVLFIYMSGIILVASAIAAFFNVSAVNPATGETVEAVNLLSGEGLVLILTESINNFIQFPALGMVLAVMLGIGIAEKTGYFEALMKRTIEIAPEKMILPILILVGIISNVAGDAGPVILPPIAAMVLMRIGYHPLVGLLMAYATVNGALSANVVLGITDALALGFTEKSAQLVNPDYTGNIAMNYYFIAASSFVLAAVIYFVTKKVTAPRLGSYQGASFSEEKLTGKEISALRRANLSVLIAVAVLLFLTLPENGILRNPETGSIINGSPLMNSAVFIITILFFIPGLVYGLRMKTIRSSKDFGEILAGSMATMSGYIVLVFFAAQMLAYFEWSNLGPILAVNGADLLESLNIQGIPLFISFILVVGLINLLIGSASAKWAILAPVFVPMFMFMGYDPAFTQMVYRVGDSFSNPISPLLPYLPLLLTYARKYDKDIKLGTLIANLLPYSIALLVVWTLFLIIWYLLGIPVGPGGPIYLEQ